MTLTFLPRFTATVRSVTFCRAAAVLAVSSREIERFLWVSATFVKVFCCSDIGETGGAGSTVGNSR